MFLHLSVSVILFTGGVVLRGVVVLGGCCPGGVVLSGVVLWEGVILRGVYFPPDEPEKWVVHILLEYFFVAIELCAHSNSLTVMSTPTQ